LWYEEETMCRKSLPLLLVCLSISAAAPNRASILIELFTSEGCSSCPPADRVLEALDPSAIVLSEHVDYWDQLGWRDPFSSHAHTLRQQAYARRFAKEGPYTPQMVVDGLVEFNGSDGRRASQEIARAAKREHVPMQLSVNGGQLGIETGPVSHTADVLLAIAEDHQVSQVTAGENKGRNLRHVAVVRSMKKVGSVRRGTAFTQSVPLPSEAAGKRLIVFIQASDHGQVAGAGFLIP
jgi:hypothetical protein